MSEVVIIREFLNRHEAELAKGLLAENGIETAIFADDCGGIRPGMAFGATIKLKGNSGDLDKAREILKAIEQEGQ